MKIARIDSSMFAHNKFILNADWGSQDCQTIVAPDKNMEEI